MSDWRVNTTAEVVVVGERRGGRQAKAEANIFGPLEHTLARFEQNDTECFAHCWPVPLRLPPGRSYHVFSLFVAGNSVFGHFAELS